MEKDEKFITTEVFNQLGGRGEKEVWEEVQEAFAARDCIGYWRYPIFSQEGEFRKEPDILIVDRCWGLIVIEVKSMTIDQITGIRGHRWEYQNFYTNVGNPYQQAENQLFALLKYSDREPSLQGQITGRALIALPSISQHQWQSRGFDQLPSNPPILFQETLSSDSLLEEIHQTLPLVTGQELKDESWQLLLSVLGGTPLFCQPTHRVLAPSQSRGKVLQQVRTHIAQFDHQQERIGKQIPPGPQRIRGIAESGKTVLLCQKAAHMHLKHPEWKIAVVFFSRSLYPTIIEQLDRWLDYFSQHQQGYDPNNRYLRVLHAWGSRTQPGLYRFLAQMAGVNRLSVKETHHQQPNQALAEACIHLLQSTPIPQVFDAILIDEGQDLMVDSPQFDQKQPFYWMAYQALRPANPVQTDQRRLIWAYDEAQSLASFKIPTASEVLGEAFGQWVTGTYPGGIRKSEVLSRCYRTPGPVLRVAHGMGMGLLHPQGMLTGMTCREEWQALGYRVEGEFVPGRRITLHHCPENGPHPLLQCWQGPLIQWQRYGTRQQELSGLAGQILQNLRQDGLRPSRDILVIVLGTTFEAMQLETYVANFLIQQGIDIFIPGTGTCNCLKEMTGEGNPNQFWYEGAVTISRIHRAKGNEADMVYVVGLDQVAKASRDLHLRNQLLIALTRTRGWVNVSGIGSYPLYEEMERVLESGDQFTFIFRRPPEREIGVTDGGNC